MIQIDDKKKCSGCTACYSICPKKCILMKPDSEGFLYPSVDIMKCIDCGLCEKVCPELYVLPDVSKYQKAFLVQIKDEKIRNESTSGGAFTGIASYVLNLGGVVFGVSYGDNFHVAHSYVESIEDLNLFRNSKYVQSDLGDTFSKVKYFLRDGRWVCFSGTPCQVEGLCSFLGKKYDNLILVDVVCHAVPSPAVWRKYLEVQNLKLKAPITKIKFRDKIYGYKYSNMTFYSDEEMVYHRGVESDMMLRAFFSNICDRPACYDCSFKKRYRKSDFTIWDCFNPGKFDKSLDDDRGTTRVLIHSYKGIEVFDSVKNQFRIFEVSPDNLVDGVHEMFHSVCTNPKRERFFLDLNQLNLLDFSNKYFRENWKVFLERLARIVSYKLGIYVLAKNCFKFIFSR
jgi:NAD-dependent dihydropyrimidine dehydrogenase PreA subunit